MTQRKPPDRAWESFVEEQIREAQEAGEFDDLAGFGKPLAGIDDPLDENWWIREKLRRENLSALPPGLEIRLEVHRTLERIRDLSSESAVRTTLDELNEKIRHAHYAAVWGPPSTTLPIDVDQAVSEWRHHRSTTVGNP